MTDTVELLRLPNSDGSCELTRGKTKVVVAVTGPIEPKPRQAMANVALLEVVVRPIAGVSTTRERLLEDKIRGLLQRVIVRHQFPRQLIQVVVQFLTGDGAETPEYTANDIAGALLASFYALIDANIPLYTSFVALLVAVVDGAFVHNPSPGQLQKLTSHHALCFSISAGAADELVFLDSAGDFSELELFDVIAAEAERAAGVHAVQRQVIEAKLKRDYQWS